MSQTNSITIIETGLARCVAEPRGSHGLEGYGLGQSYRFERCQDGKGRYAGCIQMKAFPTTTKPTARAFSPATFLTKEGS